MRFLSDELKAIYGEKVYRLSLASGCTCPNRDGTLGTGGCTFCSAGGSGEFAAHALQAAGLPDSSDIPAYVDRQLSEAKARIRKKTSARKFIAYYQSYTNTYGDPGYLRALYLETIRRPEIVCLSLGTRPDCLPEPVLSMLAELNAVKPVWIELGLQTAHDETAEAVRRGYPLAVFEEAYRKLKALGLTVVVHVIFGLPGETRVDMLDTIRYLSSLTPVLDGIKIQMLQVLRGSLLGVEYEAHPFPLMELSEYADLVRDALALLPGDTVVHRITGDGPKNLLLAPLWCADKKRVLNTLHRVILS